MPVRQSSNTGDQGTECSWRVILVIKRKLAYGRTHFTIASVGHATVPLRVRTVRRDVECGPYQVEPVVCANAHFRATAVGAEDAPRGAAIGAEPCQREGARK